MSGLVPGDGEIRISFNGSDITGMFSAVSIGDGPPIPVRRRPRTAAGARRNQLVDELKKPPAERCWAR